MKKLLLITDAWSPQVNGVVNTLKNVIKESSWDIEVINPSMFKTFPCPGYSEIRLSLVRRNTIIKIIKEFEPDYIHIATEGPIGWQALRACKKLNRQYSTSYHTRFPEYLNRYYPWIPKSFVYSVLKRMHYGAEVTLVPTNSIRDELQDRDICSNIVVWGRGVDTSKFSFSNDGNTDDSKTVLLYVGRISKEKNIEAFIDLELDRTVEKRIVGKGPQENELKEKYLDREDLVWVGEKVGSELVLEYQNADVFVFPSKTDTFGIVMLESMATGTPVVGYNASGPKDVIIQGVNGVIAYDDDLSAAVERCLEIPRWKPANFVSELSWGEVTRTFEDNIRLFNASL